LPQHPEEKHDGAGKELRMFLDSIGKKNMWYSTALRIFFATYLLSNGFITLLVMFTG